MKLLQRTLSTLLKLWSVYRTMDFFKDCIEDWF